MKHQPKKRIGCMLCYDYTEQRLLGWPKPWYVQPKLEGDRCRAVKELVCGTPPNCTYKWTLYSSTGTVRTSVPHINEELNRNQWLKNFDELDGELYVHGMKHEDIRSIVSRTVDLHPNYQSVQYYIFDIINPYVQNTRIAELLAFDDGVFIKRVPTYTTDEVEGPQSIQYFYEKFLDEGYEGMIIRHPEAFYKRARSTEIMKLKPRKELIAIVSELLEEKTIQGEAKNSLGAVKCLHPNCPRGFEVGTGFTREQRIKFWTNPDLILGKRIEITFQDYTKGSLKMPAFKRIVGDYSSE